MEVSLLACLLLHSSVGGLDVDCVMFEVEAFAQCLQTKQDCSFNNFLCTMQVQFASFECQYHNQYMLIAVESDGVTAKMGKLGKLRN